MHPSPAKFLLVDDLEENQIALEALLTRDGLQLLKARSGPEALELLLVHEIALAILDVQMPGMDGFELAEIMRGTERTRRVPIIFLTAGVMDNQRRFRGYGAGAVDFLYKPIEPHILRSKAEVFFDLYSQRAELARQRDELRAAAAENTRLLALEQASRARAEHESRIKDEFLATLSHELRTPLNAILGWTQLMESNALSGDDAKEGLSVIDRNARTQARLIDDLLDMSRIISGKIRLEVGSVKLAEVIDAAFGTVQTAADSKGVKLRKIAGSATDTVASGDPHRLQQVLWNLVSNAVKFTPPGGEVRVELRQLDDCAEIAVTDTGEGISDQFLPHVFDRFRQADGTTTRRHGGLGLGLSIVKNLVELHHGSVYAASEGKDRGSTFVVRLPLSPLDQSTSSVIETKTPAAAPHCEIRLEGVRILVVDDEADASDVVQRLLESCGANVSTAASSSEAMHTLAKHPIDLLISDIGMPGEDGYALIRRVRTQATAKVRDMPAIALTAFAHGDDSGRVIQAGYQSHLAKPVNRAALLSTVARLAGRH